MMQRISLGKRKHTSVLKSPRLFLTLVLAPGVRIDVASEDRGDPTKACFGWARSNKFTRRVNAPHGGRVFHKLSSGAVE